LLVSKKTPIWGVPRGLGGGGSEWARVARDRDARERGGEARGRKEKPGGGGFKVDLGVRKILSQAGCREGWKAPGRSTSSKGKEAGALGVPADPVP